MHSLEALSNGPGAWADLRVPRPRELVDQTIVVELKATEQIGDAHFAVVRSYLRASRPAHALILNFAKPTLEVKRVVAALDPFLPCCLPKRNFSEGARRSP